MKERNGERGDALLQFLAALPLLGLALLMCWQVVLAGDTVLVAREAAHNAARAAGVKGDPLLAAQQVAGQYPVEITSTKQIDTGSFKMVEVSLQVRCPMVPIHWAEGAELWIPARATMPIEEP